MFLAGELIRNNLTIEISAEVKFGVEIKMGFHNNIINIDANANASVNAQER